MKQWLCLQPDGRTAMNEATVSVARHGLCANAILVPAALHSAPR